MSNRFALAAPVMAAAFVLAACEESTQPVAEDPGTITNTPSLSSADGGDTPCVGALPPGTYQNVVVPPGATCILVRSTVLGNVTALENSALNARNNDVRGNVELLGSSGALLRGGNVIGGSIFAVKVKGLVDIFTGPVVGIPNVIKGDIVLKEGANVAVCGASLPNGNIVIEKNNGFFFLVGGNPCVGFGGGNVLERGNIKVEDNLVASGSLVGMEIGHNQVAQNLQVFKNKGPGRKAVTRNTVGENLQCFENDEPFTGGPNMAKQAQGQCF